jgi:hypothetical protein
MIQFHGCVVRKKLNLQGSRACHRRRVLGFLASKVVPFVSSPDCAVKLENGGNTRFFSVWKRAFLVWQRAFLVWQRAFLVWQRAFLVWQRAFLVWQRAFLVWQRAFLVWQRAFLVWKRAFLVWQRAFLVWQRAFLVWQRAFLVWQRAFLVWKRAFLVWKRAFFKPGKGGFRRFQNFWGGPPLRMGGEGRRWEGMGASPARAFSRVTFCASFLRLLAAKSKLATKPFLQAQKS